VASIVLILSHPLLGHPEATVQTHLVGQYRNLWNVGGHGLGIFTLRGFGLVAAGGSGETELASKAKGSCEPELALDETASLLGLGVAGGRAPLTLEGTALT